MRTRNMWRIQTQQRSSKSSYKSRQSKAGPAPFASFEDLSDYLAEDTSPEEIVPLPEITEEEGSGQHQEERFLRHRDKRESLVSQEYEREFLQRNRDISVTFGFRESGSALDLRKSAEDPDSRSLYSRDRDGRSSFRSSTGQTTTAGPYVNYNFRMIDAGSKESLMDLERRRRESCNSSVYNMENKEAVSQRGNTTSPTKSTKPPPPLISRVSSISSSSSGNNNIATICLQMTHFTIYQASS